MPVENSSTRSVSSPIYIPDVIDREILQNFIRGYTNSVFSGVSLYFKKKTSYGIPSAKSDFDFVSSGDDEEKRKFHPYCTYYRITCNQQECCVGFDEEIVSEYYQNPNKGPMVYLCHRGMIDMTLPLRINGQLVGVLFCGQIILKKRTSNINLAIDRSLESIYKYANWNYIKLSEPLGDQHATIDGIIDRDASLTDGQKNGLKETVEKENIGSGIFARRFNEFLEFGRVTQSLLEELFQSKQNAIQIEDQKQHSDFLNVCICKLLEAHPGKLVSWQSSLREVFSWIQKRYDIKRIGIFHGQRAEDAELEISFALFAMNSARWWKSCPCRLNKEDIPTESRIYCLSELPDGFRDVSGDMVGADVAGEKELYIYSYSSGDFNTLIVIQSNGTIDEGTKGYLQDILMQVCRQDEVAWVNLREKEAYETFRQHVIDVRHDLTTNVQLIIDNVQKYTRFLRNMISLENPRSIGLQELVHQSIEDHVEAIDTMTWDVRQKTGQQLKSINLSDALRRQVALFRATAKENQVSLVLKDRGGVENCYIVYYKNELNRAIAALLDNAIKYSYGDHRIVDIGFEAEEKKFIFEVSNYGIGIQPEKLDEITKIDVRAEVADSKRVRKGTGLGLYIATNVFVKELGGRLDITSDKAPYVEGKTEPYHRYITTVKVSIPVKYQE